MTIEPRHDPSSMDMRSLLTVTRADQEMLGRTIVERVVALCAEHIAKEFLERYQSEVLAKLDPTAVANLAVAAAGGAIRETLEKKMPDVTHVVKVADPQVYQRGIFGGLRRVR